MKIAYESYPAAKKRTNLWCIVTNWMSGDADHDEKITYTYKNEAAFLKAYDRIQKIIKFSDDYHNEACDLRSGHLRVAGLDDSSELKVRLLDLLDGEKSLSGVIYRDIGEAGRDVTTNCGDLADLDAIDDMYHYDQNSVKQKIVITGYGL